MYVNAVKPRFSHFAFCS